jgi:hypothetical protein
MIPDVTTGAPAPPLFSVPSVFFVLSSWLVATEGKAFTTEITEGHRENLEALYSLSRRICRRRSG